MEPTTVERLLGRPRVLEVTLHDDVAAKEHLAHVLAAALYRVECRRVRDHQADERQVRHALTSVQGVIGVETVEQVQADTFRYQIDSEKARDVRRELASAVAANGWGLLELRAMEMSLEDVFVQLVTKEEEQEL